MRKRGWWEAAFAIFGNAVFALLPLGLASPGGAGAADPPKGPIPRIEAGMHTAQIYRVSADASGRLALTVSEDKTARLWELPSGRLLRVLRPPVGPEHEGKLNAGALSPDGSLAAVGGNTGFDWDDTGSIYLFDTTTGRLVRRLTGLPNGVLDLTFSANGRWIAAGLQGSGGLRIWDAGDGREIAHDSEYTDDCSCVDWMGDSRIVTACSDGQVRLYDLSPQPAAVLKPIRAVRLKQGQGNGASCTRFSPDGRHIAVGFAGLKSIAVVSSADLAFEFAPKSSGINNGDLQFVAWGADGRTLSAGGLWNDNGSRIRTWQQAGRGKFSDHATSVQQLSDIRALPGGGLIFGSNDPAWGVVSSDGKSETLGVTPIVIFGTDDQDQNAFRVSANGGVVSFPFATFGKLPATFDVIQRQLLNLPAGKAFPSGLRAARTTGLKLSDWDNVNAVAKLRGKPLMTNENDCSVSMAISPDASFFVIGTITSGLWCFSVDGSERWDIGGPGVPYGMNVSPDGRLVVAGFSDGTIRWYRADNGKELLAFFPHADRKRWVLWASDYQPQGGISANLEDKSGKVLLSNILKNQPADLAGLKAGDQLLEFDGEAAKSASQIINVIHSHSPGAVVQVSVMRGSQQLVKNVTVSENSSPGPLRAAYFDCSPGGEELIGWHVNGGKDRESEFFPSSKFRDQFYRPDIIAHVLEPLDLPAAVKLAEEAAGRRTKPAERVADVVERMQPPAVEVTVGGVRGEVTVPAGAGSFAVRYKVRRGGAEAVTRVGFLVDGRPVSVEAPVPADDAAEGSASVPLRPGDCVISVIAQNRFASSAPANLRLVRAAEPAPAPPPGSPPAPAHAPSNPVAAPAAPATAPAAAVEAVPTVLKPKLYIFAAGIAHYKNNDKFPDLAYPPKDAQDFANAFKQQEGGLYQKVEARIVTEKDAAATEILEGLEWIQHETTAKDVAIIFLSGHGDNDPERRYYFCAQNYDPAHRLSTGVSQEQIQKSLGSIAGKVLLFIDSCHAGNALGKLTNSKGAAESDVNRLANELSSAENGVIVFASSTGKQNSLESDEWKNGAFTKAIVEGIDGKADLLQNGSISVSSLETYVAERVKQLTEGQQTPTVAKPQTIQNFPIGVKK